MPIVVYLSLFQECKWDSSTDIAEELSQVGSNYKKWFSLYIALIAGAMAESSGVPLLIGIGIFLVLLGVVGLAAAGIWCHIRLGTLRILREIQKQQKET